MNARYRNRLQDALNYIDGARSYLHDAEHAIEQLKRPAEHPTLKSGDKAFLVRLLNAARDREPMPHNIAAIDRLVDMLEDADG